MKRFSRAESRKRRPFEDHNANARARGSDRGSRTRRPSTNDDEADTRLRGLGKRRSPGGHIGTDRRAQNC